MHQNEYDIQGILKRLGVKEINSGVSTGREWLEASGKTSSSYTPIDGSELGKVKNATREDYERVIEKAREAFLVWREKPAPDRAQGGSGDDREHGDGQKLPGRPG